MLSLFFISIASCQLGNRICGIKNELIKYNLFYTGLKLIGEKKAIPSKYTINVRMTKDELKCIKLLKRNDWLKLLADTTTDWAANLILYDRYQLDAILYYVIIKSRVDWILTIKQKDIRYWRKTLK